jgi:hypothetical protein
MKEEVKLCILLGGGIFLSGSGVVGAGFVGFPTAKGGICGVA